MTTSTTLYLFKKNSAGEFSLYKLPVSRNKNLLKQIIEREKEFVESGESRNYTEIYDSPISGNGYYTLRTNEHTEQLTNFVSNLILNGSDIPPISERRTRSNAKDKLPFSGIIVLVKDTDTSSFKIGINSFSSNLKIYKKGFLGVSSTDFSVTETSDLFLIPKTVACLIQGTWNAQLTTISNVHCRNKAVNIFETIFNYKDKWVEQASSVLTEQTNLTVDTTAWQDFSKDIRNTRKFVRIFNSPETSFENVTSYYQIEELRNKLGFQIVEADGTQKVTLDSKDQIKNFLDAYRNHIFKNPNTSNYCSADHIEVLQ